MKKIKHPSVAGTFYTSNPKELEQQINSFAQNSTEAYEYKSRAVIVPHAGLVYSGQLAYQGIRQLSKDLTTLFIIAPAHRVPFIGIALSSYDAWETPLGTIDINSAVVEDLQELFEAKINDEAIKDEHSIEIQLPHVQKLFGDEVKIVPILVGTESPDKIRKIIEHYYEKDDKTGFIISSDLSHFLKDSDAKKIDAVTAEMIESLDVEKFNHQQACGSIGVLGLVDFAKSKDYSLIRVGMTNSSAATGDTSSVVGYGSWMLYEDQKNAFLKKYYSNFILNLCKASIESRFSGNEVDFSRPAVFDELGASFVTLEEDDMLRGCIGSIIAHRSVFDDMVSNAQNAAFSDPRFRPVGKDEVEKLSIAVSLLSEPQKMSFDDEEDLLEQIVPYEDGIIIKDGRYQAVYLPSVWEQLPDKKEFLESLKIKAGMSPKHFSETFEAYRYRCEYIKN